MVPMVITTTHFYSNVRPNKYLLHQISRNVDNKNKQQASNKHKSNQKRVSKNGAAILCLFKGELLKAFSFGRGLFII